MTRQRIARISMILLVFLQIGNDGTSLSAQTRRSPAELREQLAERYDIVALQEGVALVPRRDIAGIRMIQIVEGLVSIDGETLTGRQLSDRLGDDADLVVQISYLTEEQQRELVARPETIPPPDTGTARPPAAPRPEQDDDDEIERSTRGGDRVRFGGNVQVRRDERVRGDVVAIFGSADVDGEVIGDVAVIMGSLNLGPESLVRGDVAVVGGTLNRAPGARVTGAVNEVGVGGPMGRPGVGPPWVMAPVFGTMWSRVGSFAATFFRVMLMLLVALVVVAVGRTSVERIADRTAVDPVRSGLIGLLAELLFVPLLVIVIVVLAVSIIGIPLLVLVPFGVVLAGLVMLVGFTGIAYQFGRLISRRFGWSDRSVYVPVAVGVLAIAGITLLAKLGAIAGGFVVGAPLGAVGYLVEYLAWTVGLGAAILTWYEGRGSTIWRAGPSAPPPPLPGEA